MATEFTLGTAIFNSVDEALSTMFSVGLGTFADLIAPVIGAFVSLYFVFIALNWIWSGNTSDLPIGDLMKRMAYMALFTLFAFNVGYYKTAVVDPVNSIGAEIAEAFAMTGSETPQIIDQMGNQIMATTKAIWENAPDMSVTNLNIGPLFKAITTIVVVFFFGLIFMAVAFIYLMIAKIMVSLVLLLGPLFISFAFFPVTRDLFMKWAAQLLNYTLLYALFGITFTMLTNMLQKYVSGDAFSNILVGDLTMLKLVFSYLLFSGVIIAIPALSSHLTGGVGINSMGAVGPLMSKVTGGLSKLVGGAAKAAGGGGNSLSGGKNRRLG
ncbi:type IV secretion system protein VirB6 [Pseudomonas peli]|uniref:Type IV secretion system protein VirB6 n=1 Tax=Pseudomonas peli TaxID=592361 RepID=A0A1G4U6C2_9PSED|nr:type IV secretion system protein [Pseudomonas peli]NMZ71326.1 type IV secretion system protein [Pseudomonas peli]NMZ71382.1 type IV secretion system protein [Pseudomonas peli]SCW89188.1 type IV secretion system protein VirB6 [Pseudomonas peli]